MKTKFLFFIMLSCFATLVNAQTIGTKKQLVLKLSAFVMGEESSVLEMKELTSGKTYSILDMMDDKTVDNGIIEEIRNQYYKYGENDTKLKGRQYLVTLEYRTTDELEYFSPEEPPRKTGKKLTNWMVNSISKVQKK